jgi:hypothetical protein
MGTEKPKQQKPGKPGNATEHLPNNFELAPSTTDEPNGLGEHNLGPTGEAAQQQGFGLKHRTEPGGNSETYGGTDYNYGARDFGDTPERVPSAPFESGRKFE